MPEMLCTQCGKPFKGRKERLYCSRVCKHLSPQYRMKVSAGNKGKLLGSASFSKIMSEATKGNKNPRWIKDRTKLKVRRSGVELFLLKQWRKLVFERDDFTCRHCSIRGTHLHADHIKPVSLFPELSLSLENGRTLCISCHKKTPTYAGKVLKLKRSDFEEGGYLYS